MNKLMAHNISSSLLQSYTNSMIVSQSYTESALCYWHKSSDMNLNLDSANKKDVAFRYTCHSWSCNSPTNLIPIQFTGNQSPRSVSFSIHSTSCLGSAISHIEHNDSRRYIPIHLRSHPSRSTNPRIRRRRPPGQDLRPNIRRHSLLPFWLDTFLTSSSMPV
jgi:hypothetical protein